MRRLTIYSKPGCHLCDDMKAIVRRVLDGRAGVLLEQVDISTDPVLVELYGLEVPVLMVDGRKAAKYRVTAEELSRMLEQPGLRADS
jgi:glutaredoxin